MSGPTTKRGGGKGRTTKEKGTFFLFVAIVKLNIFCLRRNVEILILYDIEKLTVCTDFLKYLPKNMALLAQKLWRNFFLSKSVSGYFKTKKSS